MADLAMDPAKKPADEETHHNDIEEHRPEEAPDSAQQPVSTETLETSEPSFSASLDAPKESSSQQILPTEQHRSMQENKVQLSEMNQTEETKRGTKESSEDWEEFSRLRISNRCVPAAEIAAEVHAGGQNGRGYQVVSFARIREFGRRQEAAIARDRILIGILYERKNGRLGNGENYTEWGFTDLAEPEPKCIMVQLRSQAHTFWTTSVNASKAKRGSIFALMNPDLCQKDVPERGLHVHKAAALCKLGECPSLGLCDIKGCNLPVNADLGDRICKKHMNLEYAKNKAGRSIVGGNAYLHLLPKQKLKRKFADEAAEKKSAAAPADVQEKLKSDVFFQLDERRVAGSEASENYFRAIQEGKQTQSKDTSRVPMIGRAFKEDQSLEVDVVNVDVRDRCKTERMLERLVERRAERLVREKTESESADIPNLCPVGNPAASSGKKDSREDNGDKGSGSSSASSKPEAKRLGDLIEALKGRKLPRRAGVKTQDVAGEKVLASKSAAKTQDTAGAKGFGPASKPESKAEHGEPFSDSFASQEEAAARVKALETRLNAAGDDASQVNAVLSDADRLPTCVLQGVGYSLYEAVGRLSMQTKNPDIRRAALCARRRWRAEQGTDSSGAAQVDVHCSKMIERGIAVDIPCQGRADMEEDKAPEEAPRAETVPFGGDGGA